MVEYETSKKTIIFNFIVDGIGYFLDCYDSFMLPYFAYYINAIYYDGKIPYIYDSLLRTSAPIGSLFIMLVSTVFSRKFNQPIPNIGLIIVMASSLGLSLTGKGSGVNFIASMIFWRFSLGIGLALEDPFKAVLKLPSAKTATPKLVMKAMYIPFTCALIIGYAVSISFACGFRYGSPDQTDLLDYAWRLYEGSIFVPAAIALYCRTARVKEINSDKSREEILPDNLFTAVTNQLEVSEPKKFTLLEIMSHFLKYKNFLALIGGMYTMFATNVIFWGFAWNLGTILAFVGFLDSTSIGTINFSVTIGVIIIASGGIPGFLASTLLIERIGRKNMQLVGFGGMAVINSILGFGVDNEKNPSSFLFVWLMTVMSAFVQLTPNGTSLPKFNPSMLTPPNEPSPSRFYAVSMLLGVIVSQFLFIFTKNIGGTYAFIYHLFQIYTIMSLLAFIVTLILPNPQPFEVKNN